MGHWHLKHWKLGFTTTANSVEFQCLDAVRTVIRALGLTGVSSSSIVYKKLPLERVKRNDSLSYPIIIITPARKTMPWAQGDNVQDDIIYGVLVTLVDVDNQERTLEANLNKYLLFLQQIEKAFHVKGLVGVVPGIYTCAVEPADPVLPAAWGQNLWASALLLKFTSRENRNA